MLTAKVILPGREGVSETRRVLNWTRHATAMAGSSSAAVLAGAETQDPHKPSARCWRAWGACFRFPAVAAHFSSAGAGYVALTADHVPHLNELAPQSQLPVSGYNGQAVAGDAQPPRGQAAG